MRAPGPGTAIIIYMRALIVYIYINTHTHTGLFAGKTPAALHAFLKRACLLLDAHEIKKLEWANGEILNFNDKKAKLTRRCFVLCFFAL